MQFESICTNPAKLINPANKCKTYSYGIRYNAGNKKSLTALTVRLLVGAEGVEPPTLCL